MEQICNLINLYSFVNFWFCGFFFGMHKSKMKSFKSASNKETKYCALISHTERFCGGKSGYFSCMHLEINRTDWPRAT